MKFKRIISLLLAAAVMFAFAACNKAPEEVVATNPEKETVDQKTEFRFETQGISQGKN